MKSNGHEYWRVERLRLLFILIASLLLGWITGFWQASVILSLVTYIIWTLYRLKELHNWLEKGAKTKDVPENDGIWGRITYHIQNTKKKSDVRKHRMSNLLKRFQGIITSLPYATVVLTSNNEIDWANKASMQLLGIQLRTDRGQRLENLLRVPKIQELLAKNEQKEIEVSMHHDKQTKLAIQLIPIQKDLKLLIARDISERVSLQEMRKNFIANASHELRTPLTVIAGYLEIMQADDALPDNLQVAVVAASGQSTRMHRIIEDLLTLSRLESSEVDADKIEIINVAKLIKSINDNEASIDKRTHIIKLDLDETLTISGIESEITSVCTNLIHNAIRYTPENTEINISWKKDRAGNAVFSVEDKGNGIAPEHLSHLTERFYRVDKGRSQDAGGTGLGLAIVQHIVSRHKGRLDIQSEIGKGSVFSVTFS
ncbi:MAG TPA: phosphate regulon sensor histidine kinase PhoR [Leucothrix sp.]|nr:phosphate regulon sensor histidine kinase PhoR [Leucothrix sp.]